MSRQHTPERMTNAQLHGCAFEGWQCFHCGEVFTTVGAARDHFGASPTAKPGCLAKVGLGDERGLQMALREAEQQRDEAAQKALDIAARHDHAVEKYLELAQQHADLLAALHRVAKYPNFISPGTNEETVRKIAREAIDADSKARGQQS